MPDPIPPLSGQRLYRLGDTTYVFSRDGSLAGTNDLDGKFTPNPNAEGATTFLGKTAEFLTNPEMMAGATGIGLSLLAPETFGASVLIPAAVGGAASVGRDLYRGEQDKGTIAERGMTHAAVNMLPGLGAKGIEAVSAVPYLADVLPGDVGMVGKVASALGRGSEAAKSSARAIAAPVSKAAGAAGDLVNSTLPGGIKTLSQEGERWLADRVKQLALQGKAYGDPAFDAVNTLWRRVVEYLQSPEGAPSAVDLASRAGISLRTAGQAAKETAAKRIGTIENWMRAALGLSSAGAGE